MARREPSGIQMDRVWAMPSRHTFTINPIAKLLEEEVQKGLWADPFAGFNSPALYTNDLNETAPTTHHMDALGFLKSFEDNSFDGVLYDPPYSFHQAKKCYESNGLEHFVSRVTRMDYWSKCKAEIARITEPGGKVICFGWNSGGIGKVRGFQMYRILLVPHGGSKNDTICTCEVKLK